MQEDGLGEVEFGCDLLLLGLGEVGAVGGGDAHDGEGVAGEGRGGEDVEGGELELHFCLSDSDKVRLRVVLVLVLRLAG